ncbi:MAG: FMN-binding protein [Erysipelotrichaceae bacterium]|nr:FMN-binding protein [Erysipelotrichaceae bacterium]
MKKLFVLLTVLLLALAGCAGNTEPEEEIKYKAGTYAAEENGFHGPVKVEVEVSDDAILSITVTEHEETPGYGSRAVDELPALIVEAQSLAVDGVSGATFTSKALIKAVELALVEAGASVEELYTE